MPNSARAGWVKPGLRSAANLSMKALLRGILYAVVAVAFIGIVSSMILPSLFPGNERRQDAVITIIANLAFFVVAIPAFFVGVISQTKKDKC
jgi:hypothetical protein